MPRDLTFDKPNEFDPSGLFDGIIQRLPDHVRDSLSEDQTAAIRDAVEQCQWGHHPVDMRLSIPFPGSRYYIAVVGGKERRDAMRREAERNRHPLMTRGNIVLIALLSMFGAMLGASLLTSLVLARLQLPMS